VNSCTQLEVDPLMFYAVVNKKLSYRRDSARRRHYAILLVLHSFQDMADYWFVTNDDDDET